MTRLGVVLEPDGDKAEVGGILNPASARSNTGELLLYPRMVAEGNASQIGIVRGVERLDEGIHFERIGVALAPTMDYELRDVPGGYGCEDPRVTFIAMLDLYVMTYTAFGPNGPRIAAAVSDEGYEWQRLGPIDFSAAGLPNGDDKDAVFFPEPVRSPKGVLSLAFYHRPMLHVSTTHGEAALAIILEMSPENRESIRIAYVPLEPVLDDLRALLVVAESELVLAPDANWGRIKTGAGTPPVRIEEGWLSVFHAVDAIENGGRYSTCYSAGIVVHDIEEPHHVLYRSPEPILSPTTTDECTGAVNNVVFPTAIDMRPTSRSYDLYYGMGDTKVGRARFDLGASVFGERD
jgi:predicted GH43/DUF377 family glycosyl hydrolase